MQSNKTDKSQNENVLLTEVPYFDNSTYPIAFFKEDGTVFFANQQFFSTFKNIQHIKDLVYLSSSKETTDDFNRKITALMNADSKLEKIDFFSTTHKFKIELSSVNFGASDKRIMLIAFLRDLHHLDRFKHRDVQNDFSLLFENNQITVFILDVLPNGVFKYVTTNKKHQETTGIKLHQIEGKTPVELLGEELGEIVAANYQRCVDAKETITYEETLDLPNGKSDWLTSLIPIVKHNRVISIIGTAQDISFIKKNEQKIKETTEQFILASKGINDGIWNWNIQKKEIYFSPRWKEILGYQDHELVNVSKTFYDLIHPDDLEMVKSYIADYIDNKFDHYELQLRMQHKNGSYRWILTKGESVRDDNGIPMRMIGSHSDITKQKELEFYVEKINRMRNVLMEISTKFINIPIENIHAELNKALAIIGIAAHADRVYIFENDFKKGISRNIYEWCAKGISPQIHNLQYFPLELNNDWYQCHVRGEKFEIVNVFEMEDSELRNLLLIQDIKSVVSIPLIDNTGAYIGFVGFDFVKNYHTLTSDELEVLRLFAEIITNIYEKQKTRSELLTTKSYLESILSEVREVVWSASYPDMKVKFISKAALEVTGFPAEDWKNEKMNWSLHVHPEDSCIVQSIDSSLKNNAWYNEIYRIVLPNNSIKWIQNSGKLIKDEKGNYNRIDGSFIDITELKEKERELLNTNELVMKKNEKLKSFSQILSHNIRSFSSNFLGLTQLIQEAKTQEERAEYTDLLASVATKMDETVTSLNNFLVLEAKSKANTSEEWSSVNDILDSIKKLIHTQIQASGIKINIASGGEIAVKGVRSIIESIFLNLISNAIKYRRKNIQAEIGIAADENDKETIVIISDNGIGIDLNRFGHKIFQAGKTFHPSSSSGLGLYITKEHVESLGGTISVESKMNQGTKFTILFPKL